MVRAELRPASLQRAHREGENSKIPSNIQEQLIKKDLKRACFMNKDRRNKEILALCSRKIKEGSLHESMHCLVSTSRTCGGEPQQRGEIKTGKNKETPLP